MVVVKYSKVGAATIPVVLESSNRARSRGWRSVASGCGCTRRRKLVGAIISRTRRVVLWGWGSLQLEKMVCGISSISSSDIAKRNLNFNYDILGYTKTSMMESGSRRKLISKVVDLSLIDLFKLNCKAI